MGKSIEEFVHEQVMSKISAGEALEAASAHVAEVAALFKAAEADAAKARREARKAGWSESELRALGLAGGSRARRRSSVETNTPAVPVQDVSGSNDGDAS